jgi:hypothetical protein
MKWERANAVLRVTSLLLAVGSFLAARHLLNMSKSGIEDVPPPFILAAALAGVAFLCVALIGRYPWPGKGKVDPGK